MKNSLLFALLFVAPAFSASQSVSVAFGPGYGSFNSAWKNNAAPVWSAGVLVDNPIGHKAGTLLGLHYRQRAEKGIILHAAQFDVAGQYIGTRIRAGAGAFFSLAAGTVSDREPPRKLGSGVGLSAFVACRLWRDISARLVYDHGLTNIAASGPEVAAQGVYLLIEYRVSR